MLPAWLIPIITVAGMIFSSGVTWGILSYRQKRGEETQSSLVEKLGDCVEKLQSVVTEVEVMKAANARFEKQSEDHNERIGKLEVAVAKLGRSTHRKG